MQSSSFKVPLFGELWMCMSEVEFLPDKNFLVNTRSEKVPSDVILDIELRC